MIVSARSSRTPRRTIASSTEATSTPLVEEPKPIEEPFVLQRAVTIDVNSSSITADIELQNLTCKSCDKVLPELDVVAYYTPWYPNDGPIGLTVRQNRAQESSRPR